MIRFFTHILSLFASAPLALLLLTTSADAANYWVDPSAGNDCTGDGTFATPWQTITRALYGGGGGGCVNPNTFAVSGDTVFVLGGIVSPGTNGEPMPIAIKRGVTIKGNGTTGANATVITRPNTGLHQPLFTLIANTTALNAQTVIQDCVIARGGPSGTVSSCIYVQVGPGGSAADLEIRNNIIQDVTFGILLRGTWNGPGSGMLGSGAPGNASPLIINNEFRNCDFGVQGEPGPVVTNPQGTFEGVILAPTIQSNTFHDNNGDAILFYGGCFWDTPTPGGTLPGCGSAAVRDVRIKPIIEHNEIYRSGTSAIQVDDLGQETEIDLQIRENYIACSGFSGLLIRETGGTSTLAVSMRGNFVGASEGDGLTAVVNGNGSSPNSFGIRENIFSQNTGDGISFSRPVGGTGSTLDVDCYNSVFYRNNDGIMLADASGDNFALDLVHATVVNNAAYGVNTSGNGSVSGTVYNSIFWLQGTASISNPTSFTIDTNNFDDATPPQGSQNTVNLSPAFINSNPLIPPIDCMPDGSSASSPIVSDPHLYLSLNSPLIDLGNNNFSVGTVDIDGGSRFVDGSSGSAVADLGADEFDTQVYFDDNSGFSAFHKNVPCSGTGVPQGNFVVEAPPSKSLAINPYDIFVYISEDDGFDTGGVTPPDASVCNSGIVLDLDGNGTLYMNWLNYSVGLPSVRHARIPTQFNQPHSFQPFSWTCVSPPLPGARGDRVFYAAFITKNGDCEVVPARFLNVR